MIIKNKFDFGDAVYLVTDNEQNKRLVTGISVYPTGILYRLVSYTTETWHYEFEISVERDMLLKTSN